MITAFIHKKRLTSMVRTAIIIKLSYIQRQQAPCKRVKGRKPACRGEDMNEQYCTVLWLFPRLRKETFLILTH